MLRPPILYYLGNDGYWDKRSTGNKPFLPGRQKERRFDKTGGNIYKREERGRHFLRGEVPAYMGGNEKGAPVFQRAFLWFRGSARTGVSF